LFDKLQSNRVLSTKPDSLHIINYLLLLAHPFRTFTQQDEILSVNE